MKTRTFHISDDTADRIKMFCVANSIQISMFVEYVLKNSIQYYEANGIDEGLLNIKKNRVELKRQAKEEKKTETTQDRIYLIIENRGDIGILHSELIGMIRAFPVIERDTAIQNLMREGKITPGLIENKPAYFVVKHNNMEQEGPSVPGNESF